VLLVQRQVGGGVLGEDGEGPAVIVQVVEDQPVVGHQPLDLRRELGQEALRIELLVHRAAEGGQRRDQIGERGLGLHGPYDDTRPPRPVKPPGP
jgi:hypothetical protein